MARKKKAEGGQRVATALVCEAYDEYAGEFEERVGKVAKKLNADPNAVMQALRRGKGDLWYAKNNPNFSTRKQTSAISTDAILSALNDNDTVKKAAQDLGISVPGLMNVMKARFIMKHYQVDENRAKSKK